MSLPGISSPRTKSNTRENLEPIVTNVAENNCGAQIQKNTRNKNKNSK